MIKVANPTIAGATKNDWNKNSKPISENNTVCPATIFAKSLIVSENGLINIEAISIGTISGANQIGAPPSK